jgi:hypothetical protein
MRSARASISWQSGLLLQWPLSQLAAPVPKTTTWSSATQQCHMPLTSRSSLTSGVGGLLLGSRVERRAAAAAAFLAGKTQQRRTDTRRSWRFKLRAPSSSSCRCWAMGSRSRFYDHDHTRTNGTTPPTTTTQQSAERRARAQGPAAQRPEGPGPSQGG